MLEHALDNLVIHAAAAQVVHPVMEINLALLEIPDIFMPGVFMERAPNAAKDAEWRGHETFV